MKDHRVHISLERPEGIGKHPLNDGIVSDIMSRQDNRSLAHGRDGSVTSSHRRAHPRSLSQQLRRRRQIAAHASDGQSVASPDVISPVSSGHRLSLDTSRARADPSMRSPEKSKDSGTAVPDGQARLLNVPFLCRNHSAESVLQLH